MFYEIEITDDTQAIYKFDTLDGATERFYNTLYYHMNQRHNCTCIVMDSNGAVHRSEKHTAPLPEEEPEE